MIAMPDWMTVEDYGGEYCAAETELDPQDAVSDANADDLVLTAAVDQSDEAAKDARRAEYRELFGT
jgi:hypothetical protein